MSEWFLPPIYGVYNPTIVAFIVAPSWVPHLNTLWLGFPTGYHQPLWRCFQGRFPWPILGNFLATSGISRVNPLTIAVVTYLLSGMSHQAMFLKIFWEISWTINTALLRLFLTFYRRNNTTNQTTLIELRQREHGTRSILPYNNGTRMGYRSRIYWGYRQTSNMTYSWVNDNSHAWVTLNQKHININSKQTPVCRMEHANKSKARSSDSRRYGKRISNMTMWGPNDS